MAISLPEVVIRVRQNVLDKVVALPCRPTMPMHKLAANPCLGIPVVGALAGRLETQFSNENLQLSANELSDFMAGKETVMDLGSVVYQRVRAYATQVSDRVIATIRSHLANPATAVTPATVVGQGGLGLSAATVAMALRQSFTPLIRIKLKQADITVGITVGQITALIVLNLPPKVVSQFKSQPHENTCSPHICPYNRCQLCRPHQTRIVRLEQKRDFRTRRTQGGCTS